MIWRYAFLEVAYTKVFKYVQKIDHDLKLILSSVQGMKVPTSDQKKVEEKKPFHIYAAAVLSYVYLYLPR